MGVGIGRVRDQRHRRYPEADARVEGPRRFARVEGLHATRPRPAPTVKKAGAERRDPAARSSRRRPRERSGPIGISQRRFLDAVVRKRTTTQPRGLPAVGGRAPASIAG